MKLASTNGHTPKAIALVTAPPEAPDPPPAVSQQPTLNVFDFLVTDETPNASKTSLVPGENKILDYTPSIPSSDIARKPPIANDDPEYDKNGFSYGNDPIPSTRR